MEGSKFCTACGTTGDGTDAHAASAAPTSAAPPKTGKALQVVLIVVAVLVGKGIVTGAATMLGLRKLSRSVKVDPPCEVTISGPKER